MTFETRGRNNLTNCLKVPLKKKKNQRVQKVPFALTSCIGRSRSMHSDIVPRHSVLFCRIDSSSPSLQTGAPEASWVSRGKLQRKGAKALGTLKRQRRRDLSLESVSPSYFFASNSAHRPRELKKQFEQDSNDYLN
ncbi:hypothetical protein PM082_021340 [Marasmius tenuissimus]|nr:hypothetical protein PM082_021340 [Marasmius tenuissimus]